MKEWFYINNIDDIDSPALVLYPDRINENIASAIQMAGDRNRLRPHVKTNKISEVCTMIMDAGISKFKCATIAEAEMLAMINVPDVLLAYQPVGPKMQRLTELVKTYSQTLFSCLIDNKETAQKLAYLCKESNLVIHVFIDVNVGMNRSGIYTREAMDLLHEIKALPHLHFAGFHAYDGHIHDTDFAKRKQKSDAAFAGVEMLWQQASSLFAYPLKIVAGGTPTYPVHVQRSSVVECSPGTFIFWDWGYKHSLPDEPFDYAALVVSRVVSVIDEETICVDLGHKSVAAENPLPRVHFLNAPDAVPISQSEEHLVLKVPLGNSYQVGDILYGVPVHICPTVALYDIAYVVKNNEVADQWNVIARKRSITL